MHSRKQFTKLAHAQDQFTTIYVYTFVRCLLQFEIMHAGVCTEKTHHAQAQQRSLAVLVVLPLKVSPG